MCRRVSRGLAFKTAFLSLIFLVTVALPIHSQEGTTPQVETSLENLEALIRTLETPEEREALLRELKTLMEIQKRQAREEAPTPEEEKPNLVERFILEYSLVTRETSGFFSGVFDLIRRVPEGLKRTRAYLSAPENRATLYQTAAIIGLGIATALILIVAIRRLTSALLRIVLKEEKRTARRRISEAGVRMVIRIGPYAVLFVGAFFVLRLLGIRGAPYGFAILFFLTLLIYRGIFNISRILLRPFEPSARVLPLTDETSAYVWVWVKRFLNLAILYYFATESLEIFGAPPLFAAGVSRILTLLFPVLATVLLLQIKRMYAPSKPAREASFWDKLLYYCARFWPLAVGIIVWVNSIFIVANYEEVIIFIGYASLKTVAVLAILWGVLWAIDPLFGKVFSLGKEIKQRFPGLEDKTNRYIGTLKRLTKGVVIVIAIGSILEFWGFQASWFVTSELGSTILSRVVAIGIVVGLVIGIIDISEFVTKQLVQSRTDQTGQTIEPGRKKKTLVPLFHWLVSVAAIFVGGVIILNQLGVNVTPILAGAGIIGLAVGFGAQSLVKDFINGLFLLFEDSVAVGDVVVINGTGGLVEAVSLRTIKMRDLAGNVHVIPNGSVDAITNMTKEYSRYVFEVGVAYREDVDEVMALLKEIGESLQRDPEFKDDILEPLEILGVDKFDDSAVVIKARITTKPIKQWRVGREFNRRMKKVFDERNIEIPFPHRTVYWGEPKTGQPPPLVIQSSEQMMKKGEGLA
ncbi:MAG: mechanosensitive ion channel [Proteobacteria bacterium]|nr:mechanosensitive ion channel [Pseudomonadota bacterium]NIS71107.1 mechanosensitive ion channel [Pseudomonadota bacterium]